MDSNKIILLLNLFIASNASVSFSPIPQNEDNVYSISDIRNEIVHSDTEQSTEKIAAESLILKRLDTSENLVLQLLDRVQFFESREKSTQQLQDRVEHLETREKSQQLQIHNLHRQLYKQKRQSSFQDKALRRLLKGRYQSYKQTLDNQDLDHQTDNLEKNVNKPSETIERERNIRRIQREANESPIAFFATMSPQLEHAGVHQIYVFDHVITNQGNGYNNHNGNFVAPVSGTYVFSATLLSPRHINAHAQFTKNGQGVSNLFVSGVEGGWDTASQTVILQMQKGDDVCIHNIDPDASLNGGHFSTFAGFLLQEDFSSTAIVGK